MTGRAITLVAVSILATLVACEDRAVSPSPPPAPSATTGGSTVAKVRAVTAEQLSVKAEELDVNKPLSAFHADELDLVELVMECEDRFGVSISDEAIGKKVGSQAPADGLKLTLVQLAQLVDESPRQSPPADKRN